MLHIYIDADACPVKDEVYRVAQRYELQVTLVANSWMRTPREPWLKLEVVDKGADVADDWIIERVEPGDIVITADIPLASRVIKQGAEAIGTSGRPFTEDNISTALALRDLMTGLRDAGEKTSGPAPLKKQDRSLFLQQLDQMIQKIRREGAA